MKKSSTSSKISNGSPKSKVTEKRPSTKSNFKPAKDSKKDTNDLKVVGNTAKPADKKNETQKTLEQKPTVKEEVIITEKMCKSDNKIEKDQILYEDFSSDDEDWFNKKAKATMIKSAKNDD